MDLSLIHISSTIKLKTSDVKNMLLPKVHHEPIVVEL